VQRVLLWVAVGLYTAALPHVILVFRAIDRHFSPAVAGKVPLFIILLLAVIYTVMCVRKRRTVRCLSVLTGGAVVVSLIVTFEANPNKHIHIPEYVLMTWLLYQALSMDYRGSGLLLLVFICAAMLGVVDEILQGIHPGRTYGWRDMIINMASAFIGILTLMGIKDMPKTDWRWTGNLKQAKAALGVLLFGAATAVFMCSNLFRMQTSGHPREVYPLWLVVSNGLVFISGPAVFILYRRIMAFSDPSALGKENGARSTRKTAFLWIACPMAILIVVNSLGIWVAACGLDFR